MSNLSTKDIPEIIWPTGSRRVVGIISIIGVAVFFGSLIFAAFNQTGYITYLVLSFLGFLSLFHAGYAYAQKLTQRQVRKIDYWYLGAATIGMVLFALNYSNQRESYIGKANLLAFRAHEATLISDAKTVIDIYVLESCNDIVIRASKKQCATAKNFVSKLRPGMTAAELIEVKSSFHQQLVNSYSAIRQEYKNNYPQNDDPGKPYFMSAARVEVRLDAIGEAIAQAPISDKVNAMDEEAEVLLGLGQTIVWPFLLAFALALRISKVTVDVFGWAE